MYCANCGKKNPDDAKFCINCGSKLEKEDIFSFNKDDFKIDPSEYDELKEEYKETKKEETPKEKINVVEKLEEKSNVNQNNSSNMNRKTTYNNTRPSMSYFGRNKHLVDLNSSSAAFVIVFFILIFMTVVFISMMTTVISEFGTMASPVFIVALIFGIVFIIFFFIMIKSKRDTSLGRNALINGKFIEGTVVNNFASSNSNRISYYVVFQYKINNVIHTTNQKVSFEIYANLKMGDKIKVRANDNLAVIDEADYEF